MTESNTSTTEPRLLEFDCSFCEILWRCGYPTLLILGFLGNALCLVAFAAHNLRRETRILCTLLLMFDSLSLLIVFASRWPEAAFGTSLINRHTILCPVFIVMNYWLPELPAWTLVLLSIERCLSGKDIPVLYTLLRISTLIVTLHRGHIYIILSLSV